MQITSAHQNREHGACTKLPVSLLEPHHAKQQYIRIALIFRPSYKLSTAALAPCALLLSPRLSPSAVAPAMHLQSRGEIHVPVGSMSGDGMCDGKWYGVGYDIA